MHRIVPVLLVVLAVLFAVAAFAEEIPQRLDINKATASDLTMLNGIGPRTAAKILEHRDRAKGYTALHQVTGAKGIGEKTYQRIACVFMVPKEGPQPCVASAPGGGEGPRVNINLADAAALTGLAGIGTKKAQAIVSHRTKSGWFTSVEDLQAVKGIGAKTISGFAAQVEVSVDVNRASAAELRSLGFENAAAMIRIRDTKGGFAALEDLLAVPDTDKKQVNRARHILVFGARGGK
mgnify:CR=1 FL=1